MKKEINKDFWIEFIQSVWNVQVTDYHFMSDICYVPGVGNTGWNFESGSNPDGQASLFVGFIDMMFYKTNHDDVVSHGVTGLENLRKKPSLRPYYQDATYSPDNNDILYINKEIISNNISLSINASNSPDAYIEVSVMGIVFNINPL